MYVFDTGPFVVLFKHYYRNRFPSLWERFDASIEAGLIVSTREVLREVEDQDDELLEWAKGAAELFTTPTASEGAFVAQIYAEAHFQANIEQQKILRGGKNADPFVVAKAHTTGGTVVTMERLKPNAAKIPNICKHFGVPSVSLEGFMEAEGWVF